jgi:hypothetical protein
MTKGVYSVWTRLPQGHRRPNLSAAMLTAVTGEGMSTKLVVPSREIALPPRITAL